MRKSGFVSVTQFIHVYKRGVRSEYMPWRLVQRLNSWYINTQSSVSCTLLALSNWLHLLLSFVIWHHSPAWPSSSITDSTPTMRPPCYFSHSAKHTSLSALVLAVPSAWNTLLYLSTWSTPSHPSTKPSTSHHFRKSSSAWPASVLVTQSCLIPSQPMDCSPPGSSVLGILQARILEWVAIPFSRKSSQPRDRTWVSMAGGFFTVWVNVAYNMITLTNNDISPAWSLLPLPLRPSPHSAAFFSFFPLQFSHSHIWYNEPTYYMCYLLPLPP